MKKHFLLLFLMALLPLVGWADDPKPKVIINAAYTYKTYGDVDPTTPNFEYDQSSENKPDKTVINPFLKLKRVNGQVGEIVGSYLYYIDLDEETYPDQCDYEIVILQNNSNLVVQKADLHVVVTNNFKEFNHADPDPFEYTLVDPTELKYDDTEESVEITITRPGAEVTDPVNAARNPQTGVPEHLLGNYNHYYFAGEAENYKIIVDNEFLVVPSTEIDNVLVTVKNFSVPEEDIHFNSNEFVYRGTEYTPGQGQEEEDNLIVTDGDYNLVNGEDFEIVDYAENVHVGEATVTISFMGSYDTDETKDGTFQIVKTPLKIKAKSYTLAPGDPDPDFELLYSVGTGKGWVNGEGNKFGPSDDPAPKGFQAPSGVTKVQKVGTTNYVLKVKQDAKADDYEITYADGALTYGETIMEVTADDDQWKYYGDEDPEFTATVKVWDDDLGDFRDPTDAEYAAIGGDQPYYTIIREEGEDAGEYALTFDGPTVLPQSIFVTYIPNTFDILAKRVYLKGEDCTKVYGDENPKFDALVYETRTENDNTASYSDPWDETKMAEEGVINPDFYYVGVAGATWNYWQQRWDLASEDVNLDGYAVTPHLQQNHMNGITTSGNYMVVVYNDAVGAFTITPAPLTLTADDKTKQYGEPDPELTVTAEGLKFNDQIVADDYTIEREEGAKPGSYTITVEVNEDRLTNYEVTCVPGTFTIVPMGLKIVANDQAIDYGQKIDPYDVTVYRKVIDGELIRWEEWPRTASQISKALKLETEITKVGANKDAYTLVDANHPNFKIEQFVNGWLTIKALETIPLDKDALAEITEVELKQVLEDHKGRTLNVTLPARKMKADDWYAWVLPFQVTQRAFFNDGPWGYGSMEILDVNKTSDKSVTFSLVVTQPIPANTPFIVKIDNTIEKNEMSDITFEGVTIDPNFDYTENAPATGSEDQVQFIGVYEETTLGAGTRVLARKTATSPMEFWNGEGATIFSTNAYLQFPSENAAREAKIFIEDPNGGGTTEISGVKTEANSMNAEGWYNLNGVKMEGAPAQKGVYIKDGKKVVIK